MSNLTEQLRAERRRRVRRRRALAVVVVGCTATYLGARLVAEVDAQPVEGGGVTQPEPLPSPADHPPPTDPPRTDAPVAATAAVGGLEPGLVEAFARAQRAAADAGHELDITSGYRSAEEQRALLAAEIAERGSVEEALWWVFPPDRSMHVQGLAIDVGGEAAAGWLDDEGARFGLCRTLDWEWWHFEWRAGWEATGTCPPPARTPAEAPGRDAAR